MTQTNGNQNTGLATQIIKLLADHNLTVKQGCDLLDYTKVQMMDNTLLSHNFNNLISEAVTSDQAE